MPTPYSTDYSLDKFIHLANYIYKTFSYEYQPKMWRRSVAESKIRTTARGILGDLSLTPSEKYGYLILLMNKIANTSHNKQTSCQAKTILQKTILNFNDIDVIVEKIAGSDKSASNKVKLALTSEYQREAIQSVENILGTNPNHLCYLKKYSLEASHLKSNPLLRSKL